MKIKEYISKRITGAISYLVGLGMAIATGFSSYDVDGMIILAVLGNGTALLGIDAYKNVYGKAT